MGQDQSTAQGRRAPWQPSEPGYYSKKVENSIRALTESSDTFLVPAVGFASDLDMESYMDVLAIALNEDPRFSQWLPKLVPKHVSEAEFWGNYVSHVAKLVDGAKIYAIQGDEDEPIENSPIAVEAEISVEVSGQVHTGREGLSPAKCSTNEGLDEIVQLVMERREALWNQGAGDAPTVRWAVIGAGDVVRRKSGPAITSAFGSEIATLMCRSGVDKDIVQELGAARSTTTVSEVFTGGEIDAVYIATPPGSHFELAMRVLAERKPCLIEKPLARNTEEARSIVDAFSEARVPLYVAHYRRGHAKWQLVKEIIDSEHLGRISGVRMSLGKPAYGAEEPDFGWRTESSISGGGLFLDVGSHQIDLIQYLFGEIHNVCGDALCLFDDQSLPASARVETHVHMTFRTKHQAIGVASWNFASAVDCDELVIDGTLGTLTASVFDNAGGIQIQYADGRVEKVEVEEPDYAHSDLMQEIVGELRGVPGWRCSSTGEEGLVSMKVIDACLRRFYGDRQDHYWTRPGTWKRQ